MKRGMKRLMAMILLAAFTFGSALPGAMAAERKKVNTGAVTGLIREYDDEDGFEIISVGNLGMGLMKMVAKAAAETEEDKAALGVLDDIRKIVLVEYEGTDESVKSSFSRKMAGLLEKAEKILEVKEGGSALNIYSASVDGDESLDDVIIFIPEDCTLICFFGSVSFQNIADLVKIANE